MTIAQPALAGTDLAVEGRSRRHMGLADWVVGLVLVTLTPSVFWVLVLAGLGHFFGAPIGVATLLCVGAGICAFLTVIFAALSWRGEGLSKRLLV